MKTTSISLRTIAAAGVLALATLLTSCAGGDEAEGASASNAKTTVRFALDTEYQLHWALRGIE